MNIKILDTVINEKCQGGIAETKPVKPQAKPKARGQNDA